MLINIIIYVSLFVLVFALGYWFYSLYGYGIGEKVYKARAFTKKLFKKN